MHQAVSRRCHTLTEPKRSQNQFNTTHWTVVYEAGDSQSPDSFRSMEKLCRDYWFPLYAYVRRRGFDVHTAQDLTQGFIARLLARKDLKAADQSRGRFRTFLLTALQHYIADEWDKANRQKRGGGVRDLSLEELAAEERYAREPVDGTTPEALYERRWAQDFVRMVLARLRSELQSAGKEKVFEALKFTLTSGEQRPYAELAQRLQMSEGALKVAVHRLRKRYSDIFREEIARIVQRPEDVEDELRHLLLAARGNPRD